MAWHFSICGRQTRLQGSRSSQAAQIKAVLLFGYTMKWKSLITICHGFECASRRAFSTRPPHGLAFEDQRSDAVGSILSESKQLATQNPVHISQKPSRIWLHSEENKSGGPEPISDTDQ